MSLEDQVREALTAELQRQAEVRPVELRVKAEGDGKLRIEGLVDLDELEVVLVGAVAGGP